MVATATASADSAIPPGPITLVVGYSPGSTFDAVARAIADEAGRNLGRAVIVENRTGAAGALGNGYVAKARPNGLTVLLGGQGSHAVTPAVKHNLPYDTARDFTAIAGIAKFPCVMVVPNSLPVDSVQQFIAYARGQGGKANFGTTGVGTSLHLAVEIFKMKTGIQLLHVPYRENSTMKTDLVAGRVDMTIDALPSVLGMIDQHQLKPLAVLSEQRDPRLPQVPTIVEAGVPDFIVESWVGLYGPAGMDPKVVAELERAFVDAALSPAGKKRLYDVGATATGQPTREFDAAWRADMKRWQDVVTQAHIKVDEM
jgi:tripartite-type tricarboxylate transporter receptor subunit TctC